MEQTQQTDLLEIIENKLMEPVSLIRRIRMWQFFGETVVFTNGCFDILHRGHLEYLARARELGKHLVVGVNSDASISRLKGEKRPLNASEDRELALASLQVVDAVVSFEEDDPGRLIKELKPDILVKGGDYKKGEVVGKDDVKKVEIIPLTPGYSTTSLLEKWCNG